MPDYKVEINTTKVYTEQELNIISDEIWYLLRRLNPEVVPNVVEATYE